MNVRLRLAGIVAVAVALAIGGYLALHRKRPSGRDYVIAEFKGGVLTIGELEDALQRLAPSMRRVFDTQAGRRELAQSLVDKKLLALEAARQHIPERPVIHEQVQALEDRLSVQELLAEAEKAQPPVSDAELARAYEARKAELVQPERVRAGRILAAVAASAPSAARTKAQKRAAEFVRRLRHGDPLAKVASSGDGAERTRGGEIGWIARTDSVDPEEAKALFALQRVGQVTDPVPTHEGYAVFVLLERKESRTPALAEVRGELQGREDAARRRRAFDELVSRLRGEGRIELRMEAGR